MFDIEKDRVQVFEHIVRTTFFRSTLGGVGANFDWRKANRDLMEVFGITAEEIEFESSQRQAITEGPSANAKRRNIFEYVLKRVVTGEYKLNDRPTVTMLTLQDIPVEDVEREIARRKSNLGKTYAEPFDEVLVRRISFALKSDKAQFGPDTDPQQILVIRQAMRLDVANSDAELEKLRRSKPELLTKILLNRAAIFSILKRVDLAINDYLEVLRTNSSCIEGYTALGDLYFSEGRNAEAIATYKLAQQIDPDNKKITIALKNKEQILHASNQMKIASAHAKLLQASRLRETAEFAGAETLLSEVLKAADEIVGHGKSIALVCLNELAYVYERQERKEEENEFRKRVAEAYEVTIQNTQSDVVSKEIDPQLLSILEDCKLNTNILFENAYKLAKNYKQAGSHDESRVWYEKAVQIADGFSQPAERKMSLILLRAAGLDGNGQTEKEPGAQSTAKRSTTFGETLPGEIDIERAVDLLSPEEPSAEKGIERVRKEFDTERVDAISSAFYNDCVSNALSTETLDHARAEEAICQIYRILQLAPPKVVWLDSPWQVLNAPGFVVSSHVEELDLLDLKRSVSFSKRLRVVYEDPIRLRDFKNKFTDRIQLKILRQVAQPAINCIYYYLWGSHRHPQLNWDLNTVFHRYRRTVSHAAGAQFDHQLRLVASDLWVSLLDRLAEYQEKGVLRLNLANMEKLHEVLALANKPGWSVGLHLPMASILSGSLLWGTWFLSYGTGFANLGRNSLGLTFSPAEESMIDCLTTLACTVHCCLAYKNVCFMSEAPVQMKVDERKILHNTAGPVIAYRDGFEIYTWNGTPVPRDGIMKPATIDGIEQEQNVEVRRVLIERYGMSKYLIDTGAEKIHEDGFGTLYRKELPGDEPLVMVAVRNSTPQPDGSYRQYFLRVPPQMRTAKEAVAWTFGMGEHEYGPQKES